MEALGLYRSAVDPFWDGLEAGLDSLPPHLFLKSRLLRQTLAVRYSSRGSFRDIQRSAAADPFFHQHLWLLDDFGVADSNERRRVAEYVFRAMVQAFCVLELGKEEWDRGAHALADCLARRSASEFSALLPEHPTFWTVHHRRWEAHQEATLAREFPNNWSNEVEVESLHAALMAPLSLGPIAVICWAGLLEHLDQLEEMLDDLNSVKATIVSLRDIKRDLSQGTLSPTVRLMIGFPRSPGEYPERILGELLLSGAVDPVIESCHRQLDRARGIARSLQLPTFASYTEHLDEVAGEMRSLLSLGGNRQPSPLRQPPAPPTVAQSIRMAEGFLLADRTFQEAWEVHRWGMNGANELSARFPAGLIIEILGRHGVDVKDLVDDFFRHAEQKHFSYYDHATTPYVDTDDLGVLLRIVEYSHDSPSRHRSLQDLLALVETNVRPDGRLPVWLSGQDEAEPVMFLGEGCGTIEANLLIGLLRYGPHECGRVVLPASRRLLADFASRGTSVAVNYPRTYTVAVFAELLSQMSAQGLSGPIPELAAADDRLRVEIEHEATRPRMGPQDAACLISAGYRAGVATLPTDRLLTIIRNSQGFDGGWPAEPFFFAPAAGGRTLWYSSRLLTSALCYHALNLVALSP